MNNKFENKSMFGEYVDEDVFTVLEFISSDQLQSKAPICRSVENFTGYQNR